MLDAEFQLAVAACRVSIDGHPLDEALSDVDWKRFLALARRHRIQGQCWHGLKSMAERIPPDIAAALHGEARAIIAANLAAMRESAGLYRAFQAEGLRLLFLKGLTLAHLVYRDPMLKMSMDIDLLVDPQQLTDAARLLRAQGYACVIPRHGDSLTRWHSIRKESVWRKGGGGTQIDLHTALSDHPALLNGISIPPRIQFAQISAEIALPTLQSDDLFAYLCVHGASSAWFRLKWINDFAAFLHTKGAEQVAGMYKWAEKLGAGRSAAQALLLVERVYPGAIDRPLPRSLANNHVNRWLVGIAASQLTNPREPTDRFLGTASIHWSQLGLLPGWRFKLSEAARQIRTATGRDAA